MICIQSGLTGQGLADFAESRIGLPYFYGAKISYGVLTETYMKELHEKLPDLVTDIYMEQARRQGQPGKINTDCSGLIGAYLGVELSSSQMYAVADQRILIQKPELYECLSRGTVLWKPGHVGVFLGRRDGEFWCVEAKGIDYGTICSNVTDNDWQYGLLFPGVSYNMENCRSDTMTEKFSAARKAVKLFQEDDTCVMTEKLSITRKGENPYLRPCAWVMQPQKAEEYPAVKKITYGEGVRWLQWELCEAGYPVSVDGIFGTETKAALQKFQISCELCPDGIAKFEEQKKISLSPGSFHV